MASLASTLQRDELARLVRLVAAAMSASQKSACFMQKADMGGWATFIHYVGGGIPMPDHAEALGRLFRSVEAADVSAMFA